MQRKKRTSAEALHKVGRPPKVIGKLTHSINLKLSEMDYVNLQSKAERLKLTPTAYVRQMAMNGYVRAPYTEEELQILRDLSGEANNLNQVTKYLNGGNETFKLYACAIINRLKRILDDSKKY
ncbi:MAG: plasmid mobilization relaxosome protein MobC [Rikenellaceae bacterium]